PGIGTDATPPIDNRSLAYLSSTGWQPIQGFDIMIRAYVTDKAVSVDENLGSGIPLTFDLKQNYPNPFNPSTVIAYQVPSNEFVTLEIYNALGQKVRTLINEMKEAGEYQIMWNGKNDAGDVLSSGVYLYRITVGNKVKVMKMMLIR
ncbi:MAG TPA: T9SS type A sorting domain-containing protein, partial [Ignavibacteriaceae bacterium]|nr:T9SS type A sorting domain-containing protein [Ignavibacteriaceae bacterium]